MVDVTWVATPGDDWSFFILWAVFATILGLHILLGAVGGIFGGSDEAAVGGGLVALIPAVLCIAVAVAMWQNAYQVTSLSRQPSVSYAQCHTQYMAACQADSARLEASLVEEYKLDSHGLGAVKVVDGSQVVYRAASGDRVGTLRLTPDKAKAWVQWDNKPAEEKQ